MNAPPRFEIVVPFAAWRQAVMPMLAHRELVATGTLARDAGRQPVGLLVGDLTLSTTPRTGAELPPLADWVAVAAPAGDTPGSPDAWLRRLRPGFAQLLAVLLVGLGNDRRGWRGWTVERDQVSPLAGLRIVGPGMVHVEAVPNVEAADESDSARWTRLRGAVGERVFAKLRAAQVAVIGCSRSGTLAAGMLAALGVRGVALFDGDAIELHNLDGMLLVTEADLNANKAVALGRRLVAYRGDLAVKAVPAPLMLRSEVALGGADLLVTCVDQDAPRLRVARWARDRLVPHLDVGTGVTRMAAGERQLAADVRLLLPRAGCIRCSCIGGLADPAQAEYELHAPAGALPRRPPEPWDARGRLGSLITLNGMAVSCGIQSWLDLLEGTLSASIWHRLRWRPGVGLEANAALVAADPACPACRLPRNG
jgi:molybdopterin/thiamine biosynthesis adenylyltransferase